MLEINNLTTLNIKAARLRLLTEKLLRTYKKSGALVSLAIVGPERMRRLNYEYRGIDKPTDVLSFPADRGFSAKTQPQTLVSKKSVFKAQTLGPVYLGEVIINKDELVKINKYQAMFQGLSLDLPTSSKLRSEYLFYFLFVHGLLHLLGYRDDTESGRLSMLRIGRNFLNKAL